MIESDWAGRLVTLLVRGFDLVTEVVDLDQRIEGVDPLITSEVYLASASFDGPPDGI